jgi:hypothetical protein
MLAQKSTRDGGGGARIKLHHPRFSLYVLNNVTNGELMIQHDKHTHQLAFSLTPHSAIMSKTHKRLACDAYFVCPLSP